MAESSKSPNAELLRLMALIAQARAGGHADLAETLTERAAHCLMQIAGVPVPDAPRRTPVLQQQQQQSKKDD